MKRLIKVYLVFNCMNKLGKVIGLEKKQRDDFRKLKLHEAGVSNFNLMYEEVEDINNDISSLREDLKNRILRFIYDSVETTPVSICNMIRIKQDSVYVYQKSNKASLESIINCHKSILDEVKNEKREKVSRVINLVEDKDIPSEDDTFVCRLSDNKKITYDNGAVKVKKDRGRNKSILHFETIPRERLDWVNKLIEYSEEVSTLFDKMKEEKLKQRIKIRNLYVKVEEIIETGDYTKEPNIYEGEYE